MVSGTDERFRVGSRKFFGRAGGFPKGSALGRRRRRRLGGVAGGTQACSHSPRGSKGFNPWRSRERSANFETESQNCPTELRQFLSPPPDAKIRIYFGTAKGGGKNWLGTPFRSQNLQAVHRLKIVSWKESCARMPGPKSGGLRKRFDGETKSITPGCLPQASGGRTACRPRQRLRRRSAKGGGCAVGGLGLLVILG